eukprot:1150515-Pelagomonas_calceolata.AAC.1
MMWRGVGPSLQPSSRSRFTIAGLLLWVVCTALSPLSTAAASIAAARPALRAQQASAAGAAAHAPTTAHALVVVVPGASSCPLHSSSCCCCCASPAEPEQHRERMLWRGVDSRNAADSGTACERCARPLACGHSATAPLPPFDPLVLAAWYGVLVTQPPSGAAYPPPAPVATAVTVPLLLLLLCSVPPPLVLAPQLLPPQLPPALTSLSFSLPPLHESHSLLEPLPPCGPARFWRCRWRCALDPGALRLWAAPACVRAWAAPACGLLCCFRPCRLASMPRIRGDTRPACTPAPAPPLKVVVAAAAPGTEPWGTPRARSCPCAHTPATPAVAG